METVILFTEVEIPPVEDILELSVPTAKGFPATLSMTLLNSRFVGVTMHCSHDCLNSF